MRALCARSILGDSRACGGRALAVALVFATSTAFAGPAGLTAGKSPSVAWASASTLSTSKSTESRPDALSQRDILTRSFDQARAHDPAFQVALAEFQTARLQATASLFAFAPQLRYNETTLENESRSRQSLSLIQPLFSMERIGTFRDSDARASLAMSNLQLKEYDLLRRLWASLSDYIRANEGLRTNQARLSTLEAEAARARKAHELGQGTVTDMRDTQVRLDQARATDFSLKAKRQTARRSIAAITGEAPPDGAFQLRHRARSLDLQPLDALYSAALKTNHELMGAASQLRLAELERFKARGAFLPEVSYLVRTSKLGDVSTNVTGIQVSVPLQAPDVFRAVSAASVVDSAKAQIRLVETRVEQDLERYWTLLEAAAQETNIRLQAVDSAALSVTANEKSFQGGVRTRLDVLNSIQTQFQVSEDYVTSVTGLADQYLGLGITAAWPAGEIARGLQQLLFE